MANFFLQNTADYSSHFDYEYEVAEWIEEATATATRDTDDADHPSCLKVIATADGDGVYYTEQAAGGMKYVIEFAYKNAATQEIDYVIYDATNSQNIATGTLTATEWSIFYKEITTPATCVSLRLYLRAGTATGVAFYIDDVVMQGNAMEREPGDYSPSFPEVANEHQTIKRKIHDMTYVGFQCSMSWDFLPSAYFDKLLAMRKLGEATFFDDGDVPQITEGKHIYNETAYTFSGITNPSVTHSAYHDQSTGLPTASSDFEDTEFTTAEYGDIAADDSDADLRTCDNNKAYQYEKYIFKVTEYTSADEVRSFALKWIGTCVDTTQNAANGVTIYLWNGATWMKVARSRSGDEQTLRFSTSKPEQASDFVDVSTGYIRILVRSNGYGASTGDITLETDYVEVIVNENLDTTISLSNKAVLDGSGDVVSVENITQGTTLTLGATYTIGADRQTIITSGQNAADYIEVTYNQYYNIRISNLSGRSLHGNSVATPNRQINMSLETTVKT